MSSGQSIAIVIPTLYAAESLKTLLSVLSKMLDELSVRAEVIEVDDGAKHANAWGPIGAGERWKLRVGNFCGSWGGCTCSVAGARIRVLPHPMGD